jgi:catechol 2,3-dioxygenase-like lactoylglutathione lyase family enzyme
MSDVNGLKDRDPMTLTLSLSLVTLGVDDLARSTAFYEALGLKRSVASTESVSFFEAGAAIISLYGRDALAHDAQVAAEGSGFRGAALAWTLASSAEVDRAVVRMVAAGGRLVKAAEKAFWGGYSGYVADPDGHLWEVAYNPGLTMGPDGRMHISS